MKVKLHVSWFLDISELSPPHINVIIFENFLESKYQMPGGTFEVDLPVEPPTVEEQRQYRETFAQSDRHAEIARLNKRLSDLMKIEDSKLTDAYEQTHPAYSKEDLG